MLFERLTPENHALDGGRDPPREWAILGRVRSIEKSIGSLCCGIRSKRNHAIDNNYRHVAKRISESSITSRNVMRPSVNFF